MASEQGESNNRTQYVDQELMHVSGLFEAMAKQHRRREKISRVYHNKAARGAFLLAITTGTIAGSIHVHEVVEAHDTQHRISYMLKGWCAFYSRQRRSVRLI